MISGGYTVKCPFCGTKKTLLSWIMGDMSENEQWSDEKSIFPFMPLSSPVQKCSHCGKYYLQYKHQLEDNGWGFGETGDLSYWEWKEAYWQFCIESREDLDEKDMNNIRLWLIQSYNDNFNRVGSLVVYHKECTPSIEEYGFIVGIINDYIESFDWTSVKNPLLKAELYRESHQFEKCDKTLQSIELESLEHVNMEFLYYYGIKERNDIGDARVFRIGEFIKKPEEEKEENIDTRYKCCKNGHCYESIKHSCPWCGEEDVVERLEETTPMNSRVLYIGHPYGGKWVLTTNPNIEGKSERIRKITVDLIGKYKFYYHLDGKNPNPFCKSNIKLDDECYEGRKIVKLCDEIIDGNLNNILI